MYDILMRYTRKIQCCSVDEAILDVSSYFNAASRESDALRLAERVRADIFAATQCTASIGIGHNILLARIALRSAKPNGAAAVRHAAALDALPARDLPGVGHQAAKKLAALNAHTVLDVRNLGERKLKETFGAGIFF